MVLNQTIEPIRTSLNSYFGAAIGSDLAGQILTGIIVFFAAFAALQIFRLVILSWLRSFAQRSRTRLDDLIVNAMGSIRPLFYFLLAAYLSLNAMNAPLAVLKLADYAMLTAMTYYAIRLIQTIVIYFVKKEVNQRTAQEDEAQKRSVVQLITTIVGLIIWIIGVLFLLSNFGVNISSLLAGLGIGGLAAALALRGIFEDLLATLSLFFDKPFKIGDSIALGQDKGVVQHIGLKSTRLRTPEGDLLIVSNKELTSTRVRVERKTTSAAKK